jgi:hypothetical protein
MPACRNASRSSAVRSSSAITVRGRCWRSRGQPMSVNAFLDPWAPEADITQRRHDAGEGVGAEHDSGCRCFARSRQLVDGQLEDFPYLLGEEPIPHPVARVPGSSVDAAVPHITSLVEPTSSGTITSPRIPRRSWARTRRRVPRSPSWVPSSSGPQTQCEDSRLLPGAILVHCGCVDLALTLRRVRGPHKIVLCLGT